MLKKYNLTDLFPKDSTPRPVQLEALDKIDSAWSSGKKYVIACLPTGIGKSHIALATANSSDHIDDDRKKDILAYQIYRMNQSGEYPYDLDHKDKPLYGTYIMTITKSLQDQYNNLFPDLHCFKGKNNYQCQVDLQQTADFAPCLYSKKTKDKCFSSCICPYYEAKNKGIYSKTSVLNYRSFFNLRPFLQKRQIFICDEADGIEQELVGQFTLEINYAFLKSCDISFKKIKTEDLSYARNWLFDIFNQTTDQIESIKKTLMDLSKKPGYDIIKEKQIQNMSKLSRLHNSMKKAIEYWDECSFLIEERKLDKIVFVPYDIKPLFKEIFGVADRVLLMSATLSNHEQFAKNMGISKEEYSYIEMDSPFNPKKSPIYCSTKYNLSYSNNNKDLKEMIDVCLSLCEKNKEYKGIIHTHTRLITEEFRKRVFGDERFLIRLEGVSNEDILNIHKSSKTPTILVSPSLDTGISLDGDLGRFQIILKAPYLPLSSKRIKKKFDSNPDQYSFYMLNTLVQMAGRCTRSKDDYSITYILDGNATKAITMNKNALPKHFLNRIH